MAPRSQKGPTDGPRRKPPQHLPTGATEPADVSEVNSRAIFSRAQQAAARSLR